MQEKWKGCWSEQLCPVKNSLRRDVYLKKKKKKKKSPTKSLWDHDNHFQICSSRIQKKKEINSTWVSRV